MYDLEKPFHRLVHHFITRTFHGAGEGDELQYGIPALLGILSTPSAFGAIALMDKYSSIRLWVIRLTGRSFDVYRASVADEYFFIVYSMVVTGAVVLLKWDRLFPDRQDYDNLAALPISARQIFMANLIAMLFLAGIFAIDINAAACVIFPFAVTMEYDTFGAYMEFFIAHGSAVLLSSVFACFGLLSVLGLTMSAVPQRYIRGASLIVRIACALGLVAILGTAFTVPPLLLSGRPPEYVSYIPSVWFLELDQALLERGATGLPGTASLAVLATAVVFVFALSLYALTYYRHFLRIPERAGVGPVRGRDAHSLVRRLIDSGALRTPFQRAAYHFALKTLFRSERHCLLFGGACSIGFFLAGQALLDAFVNPSRLAIDPRLLSVPLILSYFIIISLRALFDQPADRRANWIFRHIVDRNTVELRPLAAKVALSMIVPWLVLVALPVYAALWGWGIALFHVTYVLACSTAFAHVLLCGFRKIPFTCTHTANKDRVLAMVILCIVGYALFGPANAAVEAALLRQPFRVFFILPWFVVLWWGVHAWERNQPAADRGLIFEDHPDAMLQTLDLSKPE